MDISSRRQYVYSAVKFLRELQRRCTHGKVIGVYNPPDGNVLHAETFLLCLFCGLKEDSENGIRSLNGKPTKFVTWEEFQKYDVTTSFPSLHPVGLISKMDGFEIKELVA